MEDTIGIDISKDNLDAYWLSKGEHKQFGNDKAGVKALALWAKKRPGSHCLTSAFMDPCRDKLGGY
jgi:transposase